MEEELIGQISENDNLVANISSDSNLEGNISTSGNIIASMIAERGPAGRQGEDGNGIASIVKTSTVGKVDTYTITYDDGTTTTFEVTNGNDGEAGQPGQPGEDGISPSVSISKVGKVTTITITDANGVHTATINDGEDGQGAGDMLKSVYDTNDNGIVDNAEKVNNHTVNKDVPSDAVFTDTIYDDTPVTNIESKIPNQASSINQLADKDFVNSSINSVTAFYITKNSTGDQFNTKAELLAATTFYSGGEVRVPTRNDYCIVLEDESKQNPVTLENPTTRYIYQNGQWEYQYTVNETALTASQLAAINSGITSEKVSEFEAKYNKPNTGIPKTDLSSAVQTSLDKADSALQTHQDISGKVDKISGKGLSTEDYTTAEKTKLSGIEAQANKTTIIDNLTSTSTTSALSAKQGKVLNEKNDYLISEKRIGTFINKPLYRKIILNNENITNGVYGSLSNLNIDEIVKIGGTVKEIDGTRNTFTIPFYDNSSLKCNILINSSKNIEVWTGSGKIYNANIYIEYTKTTDTLLAMGNPNSEITEGGEE